MTKLFKNAISVLLCITVFITAFSAAFAVNAVSKKDVQNEINSLKAQSKELEEEIRKLKQDKADQQSILNALQKKIANTQAQVRACNNQISSINSKIKANKAEIEKRNAEIEDTKTEFKKRLRAIYMSNSDNSVAILMGADNFADYLQLAQMTSTVSSHDKAIIEKIADTVKALEAKNRENQKLIDEQVEIRSTIEAAQKDLQAEEAEAESLYNKINADQKDAESDNAKIKKEIKEKQDYLNSFGSSSSSVPSFINPNSGFMWPVPGHYNITSGWDYRWGSMHYGIDISTGSIYGKPIVAVADGYVYRMHSSCTHRSKASDCRCGSGWGNHIGINHGNIKGNEYSAMYAHMDTVASGMYVGKYVKQGQVIGYVGTTGWSTGYHLHFGLYKNGSWTNPYSYFY
ncbi:MAG: peptidoglycan DD-metalloendopeptidase family protein [Clostridia bacterium]|nr:peptidoglycan DD-metalloendopeptidase family protein [Clostridia bacterium]